MLHGGRIARQARLAGAVSTSGVVAMKKDGTQITEKLRKQAEGIAESENPLEAAKALLAQHVGKPYFEDLKKELKATLVLKRASLVNI